MPAERRVGKVVWVGEGLYSDGKFPVHPEARYCQDRPEQIPPDLDKRLKDSIGDKMSKLINLINEATGNR